MMDSMIFKERRVHILIMIGTRFLVIVCASSRWTWIWGIYFFSSDYEKGYIQDIKYDGYLFVTLEQFLASPFYLESWYCLFCHMDTILVMLLVFLT